MNGKITSSDYGLPLPGASIKVKGTTAGTSTDSNGNFSLQIPQNNATIIISLLGFAPKEVNVGDKTTINVALVSDSKQLEEVTISTALGITRQAKSLGYAAQTVNSADLNFNHQPNLVNVLQGKNTGADADDLDRRHIYKVSVNQADKQALSIGKGIEAYPVILADNETVVCLSSTAQRPLLPAVLTNKKSLQLVGEELIPADFPAKQLVVPKHISFKAADGKTIYGQLFTPKKSTGKSPAIVYVHGGPQRQMFLGWNPMDYYSIDYALNQYLVNLGFTVLSVNYRLGLGYGYDFHKPANAGAQGASEYQDVKASGEWLANQPNVDHKKIGIYGGSYGGYLTALALGKDSKIFAAGVDIHGVNNRFSNFSAEGKEIAPDADLAAKLAAESSPMSYLNTWTSPTLIIHADDDRNVAYSQSVDLAKRFEDKKFEFEFLAIPDDTHHWMKFSNGLKVSEATAEFLKRKLMDK
ncbi:alpha/beta hydrolase family protein [Pedobacter fastidiosus]|uniref:alpha/beta hydrolase family protein n=1 Tax=Pedobacter fastidiosus TaxID=2765361 RepID=UPI00293C0011|nr:prolyl oligopeptidase family serine peptidase [Pedobacter fastidiosus]